MNNMPNIRIPLWFKGGIFGLSIFLLISVVISPLLESIRTSPVGHMMAEVISAPILIASIPLLILYSYIGFFLDAIFNTGVGYESLAVFPLGVIFMKVFSFIYFFLIGVFIVKICEKIKKDT